ncbi:protein of unknown function [Paraburkholderia kururiensis]
MACGARFASRPRAGMVATAGVTTTGMTWLAATGRFTRVRPDAMPGRAADASPVPAITMAPSAFAACSKRSPAAAAGRIDAARAAGVGCIPAFARCAVTPAGADGLVTILLMAASASGFFSPGPGITIGSPVPCACAAFEASSSVPALAESVHASATRSPRSAGARLARAGAAGACEVVDVDAPRAGEASKAVSAAVSAVNKAVGAFEAGSFIATLHGPRGTRQAPGKKPDKKQDKKKPNKAARQKG